MSNFKILVGVKRVIDYAVEEALRIITKLAGKAEIVVASIGPKGAGETLRTALAMGADRAIHIDLDSSEFSKRA